MTNAQPWGFPCRGPRTRREEKGSVKKGSVIHNYTLTVVAVCLLLGRMPRKLRVQYPGAVHHVMNRGDRRDAIFSDEADRQWFLDTSAKPCQTRALKWIA